MLVCGARSRDVEIFDIIKKEELELYLQQGYIKGRKMFKK